MIANVIYIVINERILKRKSNSSPHKLIVIRNILLLGYCCLLFSLIVMESFAKDLGNLQVSYPQYVDLINTLSTVALDTYNYRSTEEESRLEISMEKLYKLFLIQKLINVEKILHPPL